MRQTDVQTLSNIFISLITMFLKTFSCDKMTLEIIRICKTWDKQKVWQTAVVCEYQ